MYIVPITNGTFAFGPDGNLWFGSNTNTQGIISRMDASGTVTTFTAPDAGFTFYNTFSFNADGTLLLTEASGSNYKLVVMTTSGDVQNEYSAPSGVVPSSAVMGLDGAIWFPAIRLPNIALIDRLSPDGTLTQYQVDDVLDAGVGHLTRGTNGNIWFLQPVNYTNGVGTTPSSQVGYITPAGNVSTFAVSSKPFNIVKGPDGAMWFTEQNAVGRIQVAPSAPTNLIATASPTNQLPHLSWDATSGAASYNLYRDNGQLIGSTSATDLVDSGAAQGIRSYYVTAVDTAGNESGPSNTVQVVYDTSGPVIHISTPAANSYASGTVAISGTAVDNLSGIEDDHVVVHLRPVKPDTGSLGGFLNTLYAPVDADGNWSVTFNSAGYADGKYGVTVLANDGAGNSQTTSGGASLKPFSIDNNRPTVSLSNLDTTYITGPTITITASDTSGLAVMAIHVYNTSNQLQIIGCSANSSQLTTGTMTCNLSALIPGVYYIRAGATDNSGKNTTVNTTQFTVTG